MKKKLFNKIAKSLEIKGFKYQILFATVEALPLKRIQR